MISYHYTLGIWGRLYSSNMSGPLGMSFNIIKGTGSDWTIGITKFTVCHVFTSIAFFNNVNSFLPELLIFANIFLAFWWCTCTGPRQRPLPPSNVPSQKMKTLNQVSLSLSFSSEDAIMNRNHCLWFLETFFLLCSDLQVPQKYCSQCKQYWVP